MAMKHRIALDQTYVWKGKIYIKGETQYPKGLEECMFDSQKRKLEKSKHTEIIHHHSHLSDTDRAELEVDGKEDTKVIKDEAQPKSKSEPKSKETELPDDFPHRIKLVDAGVTTVEAVAARLKDETLTDLENITTSRASKISEYVAANGSGI